MERKVFLKKKKNENQAKQVSVIKPVRFGFSVLSFRLNISTSGDRNVDLCVFFLFFFSFVFFLVRPIYVNLSI